MCETLMALSSLQRRFLYTQRRKAGRALHGKGIVVDILAFDRIHELVDYELSCLTKYEQYSENICGYHKVDFNSLDKENKERPTQHHYKSICLDKK